MPVPMNDPELIAFLRRKLRDLLMATLDYEECLEQTAPEREADVAAALRAGCGDAATAEIVHGIVRRAAEPTGEKRAAAWAKVREAGTMTFHEAIQADAEMTDAQRAHWFTAE